MNGLLNYIKTADLSDPNVLIQLAQALQGAVASESFFLHECTKPTCSPESYAMSRKHVDQEFSQAKEILATLHERLDIPVISVNVWD